MMEAPEEPHTKRVH